MTDLSGITITTGILPASVKEKLTQAVERIGAKIVDGVRIDTTHFVTMEGRGQAWEKAVETNIPVVRPEWVEACEKNGRILGVTKFYLDAMRLGPTDEPAPAPAPAAPKDLPTPPSQPEPKSEQESPKPETPEEKEEESRKEEEKEEKDDDDDDSEDEPEEKSIRPTIQDEQKVRLEDKQEQKVALHPGPPDTEPESEKKADKADEESADDEAKPKAATPDGTSFQDVEL